MPVAALYPAMSRDRTRTRERSGSAEEAVSGVDVGLEEDAERGAADDAAGRMERVGARAKRLFSPRAFVAALLLAVGGLVAGTAAVPLPGAGLLGVALAAFVTGLAAGRRRYLEAALAGGVAVAASALLDYAGIAALSGVGAPLAAVAGAAAGLVGHYFGRDLRDGLTREL